MDMFMFIPVPEAVVPPRLPPSASVLLAGGVMVASMKMVDPIGRPLIIMKGLPTSFAYGSRIGKAAVPNPLSGTLGAAHKVAPKSPSNMYARKNLKVILTIASISLKNAQGDARIINHTGRSGNRKAKHFQI